MCVCFALSNFSMSFRKPAPQRHFSISFARQFSLFASGASRTVASASSPIIQCSNRLSDLRHKVKTRFGVMPTVLSVLLLRIASTDWRRCLEVLFARCGLSKSSPSVSNNLSTLLFPFSTNGFCHGHFTPVKTWPTPQINLKAAFILSINTPPLSLLNAMGTSSSLFIMNSKRNVCTSSADGSGSKSCPQYFLHRWHRKSRRICEFRFAFWLHWVPVERALSEIKTQKLP